MNVLVACEESQIVTCALRRLGHTAFSCDIIRPSGTYPEWHILQDVSPLLNGCCSFTTLDGIFHSINSKWDLIIAFPPCTFLACSSAIRLFNKDGSIKDTTRYKKGIAAASFFSSILSADCDKIAVENPTMLKCFGLPPCDQVIQPYFFGDPWKKRTCLWLKN